MKMQCKKLLAAVCAAGLVLLALPMAAGAAGPLLAFPGADGKGKYTQGGRGGALYEVTTLEDGPGIPGSLRAAVEAEGRRTVVFRVAGTIELKSNLTVRKPNLTIAGQTAPGQGITLKGCTFAISADEVIVRNIRVRYGDTNDGDAMSINSANNVIVDHCSVSWGVDETFSVKRSTNTTVQWCFITEGLHNSVHPTVRKHSKGSLVSGNDGQAVSLHHNLWAHNDARNPRPQGLKPPGEDPLGFFCDITNNVMYDWGRAYAVKNLDEDTVCTVNLVGNYMIAGPSSDASYFMADKNINTRLYFAGNFMNGKLPGDQYKRITYEDFKKPDNGWKLAQPFDGGMSRIDGAEMAYARVMRYGGAALNRDAVDERIVCEVQNGRGKVIDRPAQGGGWPALGADPAFIDAARAAWEAEYGFDPYDPAESRKSGPDGYTYLEMFVNGLMDGLYEEDVPSPGFSCTWRWFYHIRYVMERAFQDVRAWLREAWETVKGRA
ncbi:MAG: pectate lyase [Firmicutes bacterium]|nr:pectate lyase [Bacillota bacterium]